jgi:hypothetical protein
VDVGEKIADRTAHRRIGYLVVANGYRPYHGLVQRAVELVDLAVVLLQRIVGARFGDGATSQEQQNEQGKPATQGEGSG